MSDRTWERIGALSGLGSAVLFGVALIIFLATDPTGTPRIPDIANAADASVYIRAHQDAMKAMLAQHGGDPGVHVVPGKPVVTAAGRRGSAPHWSAAIASAGGIAGAVAVLMGFVFEAAAVLVPTGVDVTTLYVLSAMSIGLGGAAFTVFFLAVGKVILQTRVLPVVIGALAFVAAAASALGLVAIFADEGVFNAATGAFGFWVRFGAFVVWLVLASATLAAAVGRTTRSRR